MERTAKDGICVKLIEYGSYSDNLVKFFAQVMPKHPLFPMGDEAWGIIYN